MTDRPMRYPELSSTEHLRANGREFLGHRVYATEKRDGANIHLWAEVIEWNGDTPKLPVEPDQYLLHHEDLAFHGDTSDKEVILKVHVSSRNMDEASADFQAAVRKHPDFMKYVHMLAENPNFNIFVEFVPAGRGPTRLEPPHKKASLILFDIATQNKPIEIGGLQPKSCTFLNYTMLYQLANHHKVPIVELLGDGRFPTLEELKSWIGEMLKWCKRHRREGIVIKCFDTEPQVYSKEKIDMPKRSKFSKTVEGGVVLPPLPDSEVNGAINKVFADFGYDFLRDKRQAMPKIAEYVGIECRKHLCTSPSAPLFQYYMTFLTNLDAMHKEQAEL